MTTKKKPEVWLGGLVILIEDPKAYDGDISYCAATVPYGTGFESEILDLGVKQIEGPLINGITALTIETDKVDDAERFCKRVERIYMKYSVDSRRAGDG